MVPLFIPKSPFGTNKVCMFVSHLTYLGECSSQRHLISSYRNQRKRSNSFLIVTCVRLCDTFQITYIHFQYSCFQCFPTQIVSLFYQVNIFGQNKTRPQPSVYSHRGAAREGKEKKPESLHFPFPSLPALLKRACVS